ncbi:MAG: ScpA family protein [Pseudomonadota bacterium]
MSDEDAKSEGAEPGAEPVAEPVADLGASGPRPPEVSGATLDPVLRAAVADTLFESASEHDGEQLLLNLGAFEGPIDVLLELARSQKVDLKEISVLELAEQYLSFIMAARRLRLDLAADYLVMAAWLAYLKSRLLLPKPPEEEGPSGEEMAAHLAFQLERLQAMRQVAEKLFEREQLGRDFFARGEPEKRRISTKVEWTASMLELLRGYARMNTRGNFRPLHLDRPPVVPIDEALARIRALIGDVSDWAALESFMPKEWRDPALARSAVASTFAATLELAKHGQLRVRQAGLFEPIYVVHRTDIEEDEQVAGPALQDGSERRDTAA